MEINTKLEGAPNYKTLIELLKQNKAVIYAPVQKCSHCGNEITAGEFIKAVDQGLIPINETKIEDDPMLRAYHTYICLSCSEETQCEYVVVHDGLAEATPAVKDTLMQAFCMLETYELTGQKIPESGVLIKWNGDVVFEPDIPEEVIQNKKGGSGIPNC